MVGDAASDFGCPGLRLHRRAARAVGLLLAAASWLGAGDAAAYGPSVHLRECQRTAELLAKQNSPFAQVGSPGQRPWLALGCIAPDFRQASVHLAKVDTHSWQLGVHLLEAAQLPGAPTGAAAFAVGHLNHHASDASESFYAATLAASALLGAPDLLPGTSDEGYGECELWVETLGEFANGDLDALLALLGHLGVFGEADIDWQAVITWYVQQANVWHGKPMAEPAKVVADLAQVMAKAKATLGDLGLDSVQSLLSVLKDGTPASNVQLLSILPLDNALEAFGITMTNGLDPVRWRPMAKLVAFASHDLWRATYAPPFADLGPQWTVDMVAAGKTDANWPPSHSSLTMQAGARTSLAWGMPLGTFAPQHAVLTDELGLFDAAGKPLGQWQPGGGAVTVRARVFAAQPVKTWVALRVHVDPGTVEAVELGQVVTATVALLAVDPKDYFKSASRLEISTTFLAQPWAQSARGLVVALARGDSAEAALAAPPFLHGNWTLYQAHNVLDVTGPVYDGPHDSYTGWPAGLRLPGPAKTAAGSLLVRVLEAPAGNLIANVQADLRATPDGPVVRTLQGTAGGRLLADGLAPPAVFLAIHATSAALADKGPDGAPAPLTLPVAVTAGEISQLAVHAWVLPSVAAAQAAWPIAGGAGEVEIALQLAPLGHCGDQPMRLQLRLRKGENGPVVWPDPPGQYLTDFKQLAADDPDLAHLRYQVAVAAQKLAAAGVGPSLGTGGDAALFLQLRLVYGDLKTADPPETQRGPWVAAQVAPPPAPDSVEDAGADTAQATADAAADVPALAEVVPTAAGPAAQTLKTDAESGCSARRATPGGWGWLGAVLLACAAIAWRRRRSR